MIFNVEPQFHLSECEMYTVSSSLDTHFFVLQRLNKMARLVFNKDNLMQIKEGLNLLFDLFIDVIDTPFEHGNCFTHSEVMLRFESVVSPSLLVLF